MGNESGFDRLNDKSSESVSRGAELSACAAENEAVTGRRLFLQSAVAGAAAFALPKWAHAATAAPAPADEMEGIRAQIE